MKEIPGLPLNALDVDVKAELIQALIPIGFWYVKEALETCEADRYINSRITKGGQRGKSSNGRLVRIGKTKSAALVRIGKTTTERLIPEKGFL